MMRQCIFNLCLFMVLSFISQGFKLNFHNNPIKNCFARKLASGTTIGNIKKKPIKKTDADVVDNSFDGSNGGKVLVIVESPSKAKTIQTFLDPNKYIVDSSYGHVRELVKSKTAPIEYKNVIISQTLSLKVSNIGIDVHNNFQPLYIITDTKQDIVKRLIQQAKSCDSIIFATDEDREGEAISWHLLQILQPSIPYKRAVFHEISKNAIDESFRNLRDIDMDLVQAQQARSILDKLAGYTLSPILWKYVAFGLSAGRVQSCALKLIVEKESKRWDWVIADYFSVEATLSNLPPPPLTSSSSSSSSPMYVLSCQLHSIDNRRIATEKNFDPKTGKLKEGKSVIDVDTAAIADEDNDGDKDMENTNPSDILLLDRTFTQHILTWLTRGSGVSGHDSSSGSSSSSDKTIYRLTSIDQRHGSRSPPPAFTTSSLQQEASKRLSLSPSQTMRLAQGLYESGFITYMRTDSAKLSETASTIAENMIHSLFGTTSSSGTSSKGKNKTNPYIAEEERLMNIKKTGSATGAVQKNAQEAHEAIRPVARPSSSSSSATASGGEWFYWPAELLMSDNGNNGKGIAPLTAAHVKLYTLILQRTLASLMANSLSVTHTYTILATSSSSSSSSSSTGTTSNAKSKSSTKTISSANNLNNNSDNNYIYETSTTTTTAAAAIESTQTPDFQEMKFRASSTEVIFDGYLAVYEDDELLFSSSSSSFASKRGGSVSAGGKTKKSSSSSSSSSMDLLKLNSQFYLRPDLVSSSSSSSTINNDNDIDNDDNNNRDNNDKCVRMSSVVGTPHTTRPPVRYSEASFIKELEDVGVGRPSTYSTILQTLKDREYIMIDQRTILPTIKGIIVNKLLDNYFRNIVNVSFTAEMETELDLIARGKRDKVSFLKKFYLGINDDDDDEGNKAKGKSETVSGSGMRGLLYEAENIVLNNAVDKSVSCSFTLPTLGDLHGGRLYLSSTGLNIEQVAEDDIHSKNKDRCDGNKVEEDNNNSYHSNNNKSNDNSNNNSNVTSDSNNNDSNESNNMNNNNNNHHRRWILPASMQLDIRTLTRDAILHIMSTQSTTQGVQLPVIEGEENVYIKAGQFGKYLQIGDIKDKNKLIFSVPEYLDPAVHSRENLLEFSLLPRPICMHPLLNNMNLILQIKNKKLCVGLEGLPITRLLPDHILFPSQVTHEIALAAYQDLTLEKWKKMNIGEYQGINIYVIPNRNNNGGHYLKWGNAVASIGKQSKDEAFMNALTIDQAINIIQTKGYQYVSVKGSKKSIKVKLSSSDATAKLLEESSSSSSSRKSNKAKATKKESKAVMNKAVTAAAVVTDDDDDDEMKTNKSISTSKSTITKPSAAVKTSSSPLLKTKAKSTKSSSSAAKSSSSATTKISTSATTKSSSSATTKSSSSATTKSSSSATTKSSSSGSSITGYQLYMKDAFGKTNASIATTAPTTSVSTGDGSFSNTRPPAAVTLAEVAKQWKGLPEETRQAYKDKAAATTTTSTTDRDLVGV